LNPLINIFDFFLPRFCSSCKIKLPASEKFVCSSCLNNIKKATDERLSLEFKRKFFDKKVIRDFKSLYVFEKDKELQNIIHSLKYNGRFLIGIFLGSELGKKIKNEIWNSNINLIVPVPLHQLKKAERGYNQSFYIAKGLSKEVNIPFGSGIIKRKKYTQSQTTMNLKERQKNIEEAFKVRNDKKIKEKNILLIDDVITTGATISECGKILLDSGAASVYAASVAIAD
jgi:ComF family protein